MPGRITRPPEMRHLRPALAEDVQPSTSTPNRIVVGDNLRLE